MAKRKQSDTKAAAPKKPTPSTSALPIPSTTKKSFFKNKRARFEGTLEIESPAPKPIKKTPKSVKKVVKIIATPPAPKTFIVSVGSYERLLYGLSCSFTITGELKIEPIFSFPAHLSSLRSVSASLLSCADTGSERKVGGKYLVSGGVDEVIKVWDLKRRKEVGSLEGEASGTITCLRFVPQRNMLLAASTDSAITMYRVRDWVLLRSLKGHRGRVNSIDAHPAGRVALSVGQDKMLRMWDLVAGKAVATMKIREEGDIVRWNTDGSKFGIICGMSLTIYGIDMTIHHILTSPSRFHDLRFAYFPIDASDPEQKEYLFVACEDGKTRIFDITTSAQTAPKPTDEGDEEIPPLEVVGELIGHKNRVKMIDMLEVALPSEDETAAPITTIVLTTISSDGKINLYDLASLKLARSKAAAGEVVQLEPSASHDTDGSRLTCVCAVGLAPPRKSSSADEEEEDDDDSEAESDSEEEFEEFDGIASESDGTGEEQELEMEDFEDEDEQEEEEE